MKCPSSIASRATLVAFMAVLATTVFSHHRGNAQTSPSAAATSSRPVRAEIERYCQVQWERGRLGR